MLNCCVLFVHHTGKGNARDQTTDQYSGRGGSAFADGSRMVLVLHSLTAENWKKSTGLALGNGEQGLRLTRAKMSYCRAQAPMYSLRSGYAFAEVAGIEPTAANPEADADQVVRLVESEALIGRTYSKRSLEALSNRAGMTRQQFRDALGLALAYGKLVEKDLPPDQRKGVRKTFLSLPEVESNCAKTDGAMDAQKVGNEGVGDGEFYCAESIAPPLRKKRTAQLNCAVSIPVVPSIAPNDNGAIGAIGAIGEVGKDQDTDPDEIEGEA